VVRDSSPPTWSVTDDWPKGVRVTEVEIDVFGRGSAICPTGCLRPPRGHQHGCGGSSGSNHEVVHQHGRHEVAIYAVRGRREIRWESGSNFEPIGTRDACAYESPWICSRYHRDLPGALAEKWFTYELDCSSVCGCDQHPSRRTLMRSMTPDEAREFAERWLPAWTGNNPLKLASFYTDDLSYSDPTLPDGVIGKEAFIRYLSKLLGNNPDWVWTHELAIPMQDGFLNKWRVDAPVGDRVITCSGVCTVQMTGGLSYRNETYFATLHLITAMRDWNTKRD